jgi:hypothetical protein
MLNRKVCTRGARVKMAKPITHSMTNKYPCKASRVPYRISLFIMALRMFTAAPL